MSLVELAVNEYFHTACRIDYVFVPVNNPHIGMQTLLVRDI